MSFESKTNVRESQSNTVVAIATFLLPLSKVLALSL